MSAYNRALAMESISDDMKAKWNQESDTFIGLTHNELEQFARTVAYKTAHNISNGHLMDKSMNPLNPPTCSDCGCTQCEDGGSTK